MSILLICLCHSIHAQHKLYGSISDFDTAEKLGICKIQIAGTTQTFVSSDKGSYEVSLSSGNHVVIFECIGYASDTVTVVMKDSDKKLQVKMVSEIAQLDPVEISESDDLAFGIIKMRGVEGAGIYKSKKANVVKMNGVSASKSTNNAREIYSQIAGLNIWESDGGGLQLGIGGRGLSPDRSSNFNVRQNGYDISADALGYPESYYTPPSEAIERVDIVRGAASLQYGTQFGGMVNFRLKEPFNDRKFGALTRNTIGSNGLYSNFTHLGGRHGTLRYNGFINYKQGDDFRPNAAFDQLTGFLSVTKILSENTTLGAELTHMNYLAQQPGGLTDDQFQENPYASFRERNWFAVDWNLAAIRLQSKLSPKTLFDLRTFGLLAKRESLGTLVRADRTDPLQERTLISGTFNNLGTEARLLKWYGTDTLPHVLLGGVRVYTGRSTGTQGAASNASTPDFYYINPDSLDSDYLFPSYNVSAFVENIFTISDKFSITPGVRFEHIVTKAQGFYAVRFLDNAGNLIEENIYQEDQTRPRSFVILGLGASYEPNETVEVYGNLSQNYRAITFNDIRVVNPNFRIDPNIMDERGYSADLGFRGTLKRHLAFDINGFYLFYNDRIGLVSQVDDVLNSVYMLRTNISNSRNMGVEGYANFNVAHWLSDSAKWDLNLFASAAYIDARYLSDSNVNIDGNRVELAPEFTWRAGTDFRWKNFELAWKISYTGAQFTDATNSTFTANAVNGLIPEYLVQDLSVGYEYKWLRVEAGINNLTNEAYFTRRASGYPGPGILPSAGRIYYATLQLSIP